MTKRNSYVILQMNTKKSRSITFYKLKYTSIHTLTFRINILEVIGTSKFSVEIGLNDKKLSILDSSNI